MEWFELENDYRSSLSWMARSASATEIATVSDCLLAWQQTFNHGGIKGQQHRPRQQTSHRSSTFPIWHVFMDSKVGKEKVEGNAIQNMKTISFLEEEPNYNLI